MKNKIRKITVSGCKYHWSVSKVNGDGDYGYLLKVWKEGKDFHSEWVGGYGNDPTTPAIVAQKIKEVLAQPRVAGGAIQQADGSWIFYDANAAEIPRQNVPAHTPGADEKPLK